MFHRMILVTLSLLFSAVSLKAQTPPSQEDRAAYTGLLGVTSNKAHNEIRQFIVNGVPLETTDRAKRTAFLVAAYNADIMGMEILAKAGANTRAKDDRNYDAITILSVANQPDALKSAIALGGDIKAITSPYLGSALIAAAHLGHGDIVRILIEAGATLDHVNNLGWTALIESIVLGDGGANHQHVLRDLLAAGANPNIPDKNGISPLALARSRGFKEMEQMLLHKGAR
jgi:uncharacterized protein